MKKLCILLFCISIFSCSKIDMNEKYSVYSLEFFNRASNNIMVGFGDFYNYYLDNNNLSSSNFSLFIMPYPVDYSSIYPVIPYTRPEYYKNNLLAPDATIENEISNYFHYKSSTNTVQKGAASIATIQIEYRPEELKELNIYSTSPIFGKNSGESLNNLFRITYIGPYNILISSANKKVLKDKSQDYMPHTISELVNNNVLTPSMIILKRVSTEQLSVPVTTSFIVKMKVGNKELSFETETVTIK